MRLFILLLALGACLRAFGQDSAATSLFSTVRPEASIVVRKHASGSEVVLVSMLEPAFPKQNLRQIAETMAEQIGQKAQGLIVFDDQPSKEAADITIVRAQFGLDGLSDSKTGTYRLQPIARAFAGIPPPNSIEGIDVIFEEMRPGPNTIRTYEDEGTAVELSPQSGPIGVEYRIEIRSQDPSKINIPESRPVEKPAAQKKARAGPDWVAIVLGIVAALALGALVYSLLLRARPPSRPTSR